MHQYGLRYPYAIQPVLGPSWALTMSHLHSHVVCNTAESSLNQPCPVADSRDVNNSPHECRRAVEIRYPFQDWRRHAFGASLFNDMMFLYDNRSGSSLALWPSDIFEGSLIMRGRPRLQGKFTAITMSTGGLAEGETMRLMQDWQWVVKPGSGRTCCVRCRCDLASRFG
jgi:hypothetical protein